MTKQELLEERLFTTTIRITSLIRESKLLDARQHLFESYKTVCAWCGKVMSKGDLVDGHVTHGICGDCNKKAMAQIDKD